MAPKSWGPLLLITFAVAACTAEARVEGTEPNDCVDRADNDGDGRFDCDDEGCAGSPDCQGGARDGGVATDAGTASMDAGATDAGSSGARCYVDLSALCPIGEWCVPQGDGARIGRCERAGPGAHRAPCAAATDCDEGLVCTEEGTCRQLCSAAPSGAYYSTCDAVGANLCVFTLGSLEYGVCTVACTEWGSDPACEAGEWCAGGGQCMPAGSTAEGGACERTDDCAALTFCDFGVCGRACRETGGLGGDCAATDLCVSGICRTPCEYDGARTCVDAGQTCVSGTWFDPFAVPPPPDACLRGVPDLAPGSDCAAAGLATSDQCAPLSQCIGAGAGVCTDLCRASAGPANTPGAHPDCRDSSQECQLEGAVGVCADP